MLGLEMIGARRFVVCLVAALVCFWLAVAVESGSSTLQAAEAAVKAPDECRWSEGPIKIDGRADEADWQRAQVIDKFSLPWLKDKARPARTATRARLLWDREYLYFFADMDDHDLYADVKQHDGPCWNNDVFELFFKPDDKEPGYYEFEVNAVGTILDMFLPRRNSGGYQRYKDDCEFNLEVAVALRGTLNDWRDQDEGWSVEGRIPWRDFLHTRGRPEIGDVWKFALCRYDYGVDFDAPELSISVPTSELSHPDYHHFEDYTPLRFVGPDKASAARERPYGVATLIPWTTSRVVGSPDPPLPYRARRTFESLEMPCPMAVAHEPGTDRLLAIYQLKAWVGAGRIARIKDDPNVSEMDELLQVDGIAYGLAFHPDYEKNGYLFVGSNGPLAGRTGLKTRITRYTIDRHEPHHIVPDSAEVIIEWLADGHNGGDLAFGTDGMLYVSSGDGTSDSDTNLRGQDLTELTAKVLRIDVDHPAADKKYGIPTDNPFRDAPGVRPETWAYGLRNPWRLTVDRQTGHVWVGNNGQDLWEQVYFVRPGENYGWSVNEGSHPFYLNRKRGPAPITPPTAEHSHSESRSLTGGIVYYGTQLPELRGAYLYGDWSTGKIWGIRHDGQRVTWHQELADTPLQISGFGADSHGELLVVDHGGGFYRLELSPTDAPAAPFPARLSETGVFESVPGHRVRAGLIPYSVNAPLWSDGAYKERFIGIPHEPGKDRRIDFKPSGAWNFPEGTVLVKSFALENEAGDPATRRWIETRLLTKQQGEWVGYSYQWNDEQTEAELVGAGGLDREYTVRGAAAGDKQSWRFPSRTECMVCHSRAAAFVLGLSTPQMNRVHQYEKTSDNQLRTLEHLGLLRFDWLAETRSQVRWTGDGLGLKGGDLAEYMARRVSTRLKTELTYSGLLSKPPDEYARLPDPYDNHNKLDARARAYLQSNCAQCHVPAGGGNAKLALDYQTPLGKTFLFDKPQHHTFGMTEPRIIAPGAPDRSVLLHRMELRGAGQMPPLASSRVDREAVELVRAWINEVEEPAPAPAIADDAPLAKGVRVLSTGNSFSGGVLDGLQDLARLAGIKDHVWFERQGIGGSRVIQHWDLPDDQNKAKRALLTGNVDVMTMNPIFMPDEGIARFVKLGLEHNPNTRFTIQQSWLIFDQVGVPDNEPLYSKRKYDKKFDPNTRTGPEIRKEYAPVLKALEDHVRELNKQQGKDVVFVVPTAQASILLREKIIARQAPDLDSQGALFVDEMCHPSRILQTLGAYCHFAVIYRRCPVGLPVPPALAAMKLPNADQLNLLLQEIAWQAVTEHPLSGVKSPAP